MVVDKVSRKLNHFLPSLLCSDYGSVNVYIWEPHGNQVGHASLGLPDGTYISWWPAGKGKDDSGVLNWALCTATLSGSLQEDIVAEGNLSPQIFTIHNVNLRALKEWWRKNNYGTYS